jgi:hypothetical protein
LKIEKEALFDLNRIFSSMANTLIKNIYNCDLHLLDEILLDTTNCSHYLPNSNHLAFFKSSCDPRIK